MYDTLRALAEVQFTTSGEIVHGKHLGRSIGFPTANLRCLARDDLPPNGVYIAMLRIDSGEYSGCTLPCVLNQGHQPTAPSGIATIEAYIPGFSGDLYNAHATITYLRFLRAEQRFPSLEALKAQLARDTQQTCDYFAEHGYPITE